MNQKKSGGIMALLHGPRLVLIGLAALVLCGCGFQLRSYDFQSNVESYALAGKTRLQIAAPLRQALSQARVSEADVAQASVVVELLDQRRERRSISTGSSARAAEYETSYAVQYRILKGAAELSPATWIERQRVYRIDRGNIVGSSEEQALLEREMMQDIAGQIIRAMDAVTRTAAQSADNAG